MAVKIEDIARLANVSPATVSFALNGKSGVGEQKREKILQIAKDLNYEKKKIQNLTSLAEKGTIRFLRIVKHGHTINRDHDVFIADYIDGLTEGANYFGYNLEIDSYKDKPILEIINAISASKIQGIIVLGTELTQEDIIVFNKLDIPVVFIDTYHDYLQYDFVDMNNKDGIFKMVKYFFQNNFTDIGFLRSTVKTRNFRLREEAFRETISFFNLELKDNSIITIDSTFEGSYLDCKDYLAAKPHLPECLVSTNDIMAFGCIKALVESGIKVPEDISIIGFDDLPLSSMMNPSLSTISVSKHEIGKTAIQLVNNRILGDIKAPPVKVLVGGKLIIRDSVK